MVLSPQNFFFRSRAISRRGEWAECTSAPSRCSSDSAQEKPSCQPSVPGNCFAPDQKRPRDSPNDCRQGRVPPKWHGMAACSTPTYTYIFYHPSPTSQQKFHRFRLKIRSFFFTLHGMCEKRRHCTWANLWYNIPYIRGAALCRYTAVFVYSAHRLLWECSG